MNIFAELNFKKRKVMKKSILFLLAFSLLAVSCKKDEPDTPPVAKTVTLDDIIKEFKFLNDAGVNPEVDPTAKKDLEAWVVELNKINKVTTKATEGKAGKLGKRVVNAKGVETVQLIKKGLIGALQLNGFNNSSMAGVRAADAKARKAALDRAASYLLGNYKGKKKSKDDFKKEGNAFGKYMMSVTKSERFKGIDKNIYDAIERAEKSANNPKEFSAALVQLNEYVTTVVAFRAVHYLAGYGGKIREDFNGENIHELSEGLGFAYSLQFAYNFYGGHKPYLTAKEAKAFTTVDLWKEAKDKSGNSFLDKGAEKIANLFRFTVADAK